MLEREYENTTPIWVTGAGGFIGTHLVDALLTTGARVIGFGRSPQQAEKSSKVEAFYAGGVTVETLEVAVDAHGIPGAVYHLAGGATVWQSVEQPLEDFNRSVVTVASLLDVLRRRAHQCPVVIASSAAVYGAGHNGPIPVGADLRPFSPYGQHKRIVEQLAETYSTTYGQPIVVARLFSIYGNGLRKQLLFEFCKKLANTRDEIVLGGTGQEMRDWCHVSDVVTLLQRLLASANTSLTIHNGGGAYPAPVKDVVGQICQAWGEERAVSFSGRSRPGDPFSLLADCSALPGDFSWRVGLPEGIAEYVAWFRANILSGNP
jgi:UDP-glucose 4-epimerase